MSREIIFREIKLKVTTWSASSTVHGLPNVFRTSNKLMKIMWLLCFTASFSVCSYLIIANIIRYFEYRVKTSIGNIYEYPIKFPAVSICNINPFVTEFSKKFIQDKFGDSDVDSIEDFNKYINYASYPEHGDLRKKFDLKLDEKFFYFSFDFKQLDNLTNDFKWYFDRQYGNCYKFNSGFNDIGEPVPLKTTDIGSELGLSGVIYVGNEPKISPHGNFGARLFISDPSIKLSSDEGIDLPAGSSSNIIIKKVITRKFPFPYSECFDLKSYKSELIDIIRESDRNYRQRDCYNLCIQRFINEKCNCTNYRFFSHINLKPCLDDSFNCSENVTKSIIENLDFLCEDKCPLECESIDYEYTISSSSFPTRRFYDIFRKERKNSNLSKLSYDDFKESFLSFEIYFTSNRYTLIEEMPDQSTLDLISSSGGFLGLFLGMSMLSFVEIIELVFDLAHSLFRERKWKIKLVSPNQ